MSADTQRDIAATKAELGSLSGMFVFNCILRYLDAKNRRPPLSVLRNI